MKQFLIFLAFGFLILSFVPSSFAQTDDKLVILQTNSGNIAIEFFSNDAPKHVENFLNLTESGYYDNTIFHRIISGFMIQGGDSNTKLDQNVPQSLWGTGGPGYSIDAEFNDLKHNRGIVSMARSASPDSAGSQFFIVHNDSNFLDGQYTVFGRIVTQESFDTLDAIASLPTGERDIPTNIDKTVIVKAQIVNRSEIPDLLELDEPERMGSPIVSSPETGDATYTNEKLGVSFLAPQGWMLQEPPKTSPDVPDIVALGPKVGEINPVISLSIAFTNGKTLDERVNEIRSNLQPLIFSGQLEITSEEKTKINGLDVHLKTALGEFQNNNQTVSVKFQEAIIATPEKFYTLTYTNSQNDFDSNFKQFEDALNSFSVLGYDPESSEPDQTEGGGCLIATAAFGSELAPQVQQLRELRDTSLLTTNAGLAFMTGFNQLYYSFSPTIADWERQNQTFKEIVRITLTPLLASLSILNHLDIDSDQEVIGYGISLILLNVGMYFVAPIVGLVKLSNHFKKT